MNAKYLAIGAAFLSLPLYAQETYESARLVGSDLNGTARYVGMGGAMDALGADISTISTNPAGIGMFRKSGFNVSFGLTNQQGAKSILNSSPTKMSFDQVGFYYSMQSEENSFLNLAFNYRKSKNFNHLLSAVGRLSDASQNKQSYIKGLRGSQAAGGFSVGQNSKNDYIGYVSGTSTSTARSFSQIDYLYWNALLVDPATRDYNYSAASDYLFNRASKGYIGNYDFNVSGNLNDRLYLGLTFGLYDVHYEGETEYRENLVNVSNASVGHVLIADSRKITGTGFDVKAGVIFRPIESSPFRIGLSVATPTWYDLRTQNNTTILNNTTNVGLYGNGKAGETYEFKLKTPWIFGASLGHTVGNYLALGAGYEYSDYSTLDNRYNDGGYYDSFFGTYEESSSSDEAMNRHTKKMLKGVSTLKAGIEYKPDASIAVRVGYNYVSPAYNTNAYKDGTLNSEGSYYSSATDYTNWKSTNRFTLGVGYSVKKVTLDLAYQYSATNGDFYPFTDGMSATYTDSGTGTTQTLVNNVAPASVSNKRHQVLFTLGYKF